MDVRIATRPVLLLGAVGLVLGLVLAAMALISGDRSEAAGGNTGADNGVQRVLAEARRATARYHNVQNALADGYVPAEFCVESPAGAMGLHYVKPPLLGNPAIDVAAPEILLYLPAQNGVRLIGLEYWKADADQDLSTDSDRPSLFGQAFQGPMEGHEPGMPRHYDLHVWVWKHNPSGMFAQFNPALACPNP